MISWVIISIIVLLLLVFLMFVVKKKGKHEPDYRAFFIMGLIWLAFGLPFRNEPLWIMGLVFLVVGLANREKWKQPKKFFELSEDDRKLRIILIVVLGILVLFGFVAFFLANKWLI